MTHRPQVLIVGNSHIAALREAARAVAPDHWPFEPVFMGAHKNLMLYTAIRDGVFQATSKATRVAWDRLGLAPFLPMERVVHIVIAGCMVSAAHAASTWRDARWPGLPSLESEADLGAMPQTLISHAAAHACITSALELRLGLQYGKQLRDQTSLPITIASQPRVSASIRTRRTPTTRSQRIAVERGDGEAVSDMFEAAARDATQRHGLGFLSQPSRTIQSGLLTKRAFMEGAKRLTAAGRAAQPREDVIHANATYGRLVLDQIAEHI